MPTYTPPQNDDAPSFKPLDPGIYLVDIENAEDEVSTNKNEMIKLTCQPTGYKGKLFDRIVFTERAFWKIAQVRASCGFEDKIDEAVDINADDFIGCGAVVRVAHEEYKGENRATIAHWLSRDEAKDAKDEIKRGDNGNGSAPSTPAKPKF